jgi:hypothetical protein
VSLAPSASPSASTGGAAGGGPSATGGSGSGRASPTPSSSTIAPPVFATNQFAVLLKSYPGPATDVTIRKQAEADQTKILTQSVTVYVVHTSFYPRMTTGGRLIANAAWLIISSPLNSSNDAENWCARYLPQSAGCTIVQPNSP